MDDLDFESLMNGHQTAPDSSTLTTAEASNKVKAKSNTVSGGNPYLENAEMGLQLCANLISNSDKHSSATEREVARLRGDIEQLIDHDFLQHSRESQNSMAVQTYSQLQALESTLAEMSSFPHFERAYTVAVGGSFSAGKSFFLNSVLGCDSLLPTDTTPTTSIPTYITKGTQDSIQALNCYHKKTKIDESALKAICHAFKQEYDVTFSHLLQLISVERKNFKHSNLIFLDTPGYSKADNIADTASNTDENIAREHLRRADYLIWLVDPQNGTIGQADIDFLKTLELKQPIMVVISKADKKPESQIQSIVSKTKESLRAAKINYLNVVAYSAKEKKEYTESGNELENLFNIIGQGKNGSNLLWQLEQIFKSYQNEFKSEKQTLSLTSTTIREIIFDESLHDDRKIHLTNMQSKTKQEIDTIGKGVYEAEKIHKNLSQKITKLCQLLEVVTTMQPSLVELAASAGENSDDTIKNTKKVQFDALIQGDITQFSSTADITNLQGSISKISAIGITIDIKQDIDIMIMKSKLFERLGKVDLKQVFEVDQLAEIQILNNKTASITLEVES
jgi:GTPase Era involved in 16S rRNA processing